MNLISGHCCSKATVPSEDPPSITQCSICPDGNCWARTEAMFLGRNFAQFSAGVTIVNSGGIASDSAGNYCGANAAVRKPGDLLPIGTGISLGWAMVSTKSSRWLKRCTTIPNPK